MNPANIAGGGLLSGTFNGQIVLQTAGNTVTIPVAYNVGAAVYSQVNALDFNMVAGGASPLPQLISIPGTGTALLGVATVSTSTGGNWLQIFPAAGTYGYGYNTPFQMIVSPKPGVTVPAGKYTAEIIVIQDANPNQSMVIPVTLTINPAIATFFNDMQGGATFSVVLGSNANPPSQTIPIRNAGTGTLKWTAAASTADGGNWLNVSASGTAPDSLSISVNAANLPNSTLIAGQFNGQVVVTSGTDRQTIPVAVVVGTNLFAPPTPVTFSKAFAAPNPGFKLMNVTSDGANFPFLGVAASATGGNWLSITNPSNGNFGYGENTPFGVQLTPSPALTLVPGTYIGETIYYSADRVQGLVVPVTLDVYSVPAATPVISLKAGDYTGVQTVTIKDATAKSTIYYSINGKSPTNASTKYTGPFKVGLDEKVEAIAYATSYLPSAVASDSYVITVNTPVFSPHQGRYPKAVTVSITDPFVGSTIYYTTNGKTPTTASTKYTKPFKVSDDLTVRAIAVAPDRHVSVLAVAVYAIDAATPVITPDGGSIASGKTFAITDTTKGAVIYYTTNGTTPTKASTRYAKPVKVTASETVKAIAISPVYAESVVATAKFTVKK